jgi:hypothetical protein
MLLNRVSARFTLMNDTIAELQRRMDAAADDLDFERQQPGAMGLGTGRQRPVPPRGWKPPPKPDPMTSGRRRK